MPSCRLSPARSLQKLRTAFSQSPTRQAEPGSLSPLSTTTSASSASTTSPTPAQQPFATVAGFSSSDAPSPLFHMPEALPPADSRRVIRRQKSYFEIEQEQERLQFDFALVGLVEPRPRVGPTLGGIEEVLCGKV